MSVDGGAVTKKIKRGLTNDFSGFNVFYIGSGAYLVYRTHKKRS